MGLRFHWRMIHGGETAGRAARHAEPTDRDGRPDLVAQAEFCRRALASGIESLLLDFALVGSPRKIAAAILEYKAAGVSQFIRSGWPKLASMEFFGTHILPIVRRME